MFTPAASRLHLRVAVALLGACTLLLGCGDAPSAPDGTPASGATTAEPKGDAPNGAGDATHAHAHEGHGHEHGAHTHTHAHAGDEIGPPPVDVGPAVLHGPHDGVLVRLSTMDEPDFGFVEVKLHDDKGDIEAWLAKDRDVTQPFDLPVDAVLRIQFPDREGRHVELRVREKIANLDEQRTPNVRAGKTNYFIFPGSTGADARWLRGPAFSALARVTFVHEGVAYVSDDFSLEPHAHGK